MLTVGISSDVAGFGAAGGTTTAGGWLSSTDIHSQGLISADVSSRKPVPRLAEKVPSLDDGSIALQADGKERVTYTLRKDVTWQDGVPFTAQDMLFSFKEGMDPALPFVNREALNLVDAIEAPDDFTLVMTFKTPYYAAHTLGARMLWPLPRHLLQEPYDKFLETKNPEDFTNLPYWTSNYVNLGPFRVTEFNPGDSIVFQAYDKFYLGRPKVDVLRIRTFSSENALFSNILAGTVDVYMDVALGPNLGFELVNQWEKPGNGNVHFISGNIRIVVPQVRPDLQKEPGNLDPRVRQALYYALDRDALAVALQGGHAEFAAYAMLTPDNPSFEAAKDGLRQYAYDPEKAKANLQQAGWRYNPDGSLVNATDGRKFQTSLWSTQGSEQEIGAIADFWRRVGLEVEEFTIPAAFTRDNQYRASYPGWETTANADDAVLGRLDMPASPATRWAGTNRAGWDDPEAVRLVNAYRQAIRPQDQLQATKALSDYVAAQLPFMPFVYQADHLGARKGVKALDDVKGGALAGQPYGNYSRNAYLWDVS